MADFKLQHDIREHGIEKVCPVSRCELAPAPRWALVPLARDDLQKLKVSAQIRRGAPGRRCVQLEAFFFTGTQSSGLSLISGAVGRAEGTLESHTMPCPLFSSFEVQKQGPGLRAGAAARIWAGEGLQRRWPGVNPQATGQRLVRGQEF